MNHYEAILNHIKADAPCTMNHVTKWANSQGFGGDEMINALTKMVDNKVINVCIDWQSTGVDLIVELYPQ